MSVLYSVGLVPQAGPLIFAGCRYYSQILPPSGTEDAAVLDMCSSWVSHYPKGYKLGRISGESPAFYRLCQSVPEHVVSSSWINCMPFVRSVHLLYITLCISCTQKHIATHAFKCCTCAFNCLHVCCQMWGTHYNRVRHCYNTYRQHAHLAFGRQRKGETEVPSAVQSMCEVNHLS